MKSYLLGFSIDKPKWNNVSQRVRRNTTHGKKLIPAVKINAAIQHAEDVLQTISAAYTLPPTVETFKNDVGRALGRKTTLNDQDFFDLYTTYINSEKLEPGWAKAPYKVLFIQKMRAKLHAIWHAFYVNR